MCLRLLKLYDSCPTWGRFENATRHTCGILNSSNHYIRLWSYLICLFWFGWVNPAASACYGFDQSKFPPGPLIAAASPDLYKNGAICGSFYDITCKGAASGGSNPCTGNPTVRVKVVDLCPGCHQNSFDLSQQAFAKIANLNAGRLTISARKYVFPTLLSLIKKTILFRLIHDSRLLGISVIWIWTV
jgi:hypothetical protein